MLKAHYRRFLDAAPGRLHFAAHSHHLWPDVTRDAVLEAWDEAARLADRKWEEAILSRVVPEAQRHAARVLDLSSPGNVTFAPNTHELFTRLLSCFDPGAGLRVLTSDAEFMSFERQLRRAEESPGVVVTRVPTEPLASFDGRFRDAAAAEPCDIVFLSHVFFSTGFAVADLAGIAAATAPETVVAVDGYHAFMALPVSLRELESRIFYLGGSYKYAQSGEGACFMWSPPGCRLRPRDTGWFASFGELGGPRREGVAYPVDGFRFWGATFDPTALYRFNAVMRWLDGLGVSVSDVHRHVRGLQERFLTGLESQAPPRLPVASLATPRELSRQGHFLAFRVGDARSLAEDLRRAGVEVDHRGDLVRFGFGPYQEPEDVDELLVRLSSMR